MRDAHARVEAIERKIVEWPRDNAQSQRLATIPGVGPITASAIAATVTDASLFRSGRELAAWIGLVPRQNSSGGKDRLGHISNKGDAYLRRLLVVGANAVLRYACKNAEWNAFTNGNAQDGGAPPPARRRYPASE